mmetsp:Transcript_30833/g.70737  ORF Transcript_30833/g.70737 Transcript_30833/m.70737 type:complete len:408 (+) Transcript_30833:93-1316(+)
MRRALFVSLALWWAGKARASPCSEQLPAWLTSKEAFVRADEPAELQGLHILCLWQDADNLTDGLHMEAYSGGVSQTSRHVLASSASWSQFRAELVHKLRIRRATNEWGYLQLKQAFGLFDQYGARLASAEAAKEAGLVFLFEGGQWLWPPVQVGHVRKLPGSGMALETLSVQPLVFRVRGFLQPEECDEIIELGRPNMHESPVTLMDKDKGKAAKEFRTSTQARAAHTMSPILSRLDQRVANLTRVPELHNEQVQILRYRGGEYYAAHLDNWDPAFYSGSDTAFMQHGHHNRMATVFWYLTSAEKGGETLFPRAHGLPQPQDMWGCHKGLKVRPEKGTVVLWYSLRANGNTDPNGLHAGCPVEGNVEKWSANFWVWNKPLRKAHIGLPDEGVDEYDKHGNFIDKHEL